MPAFSLQFGFADDASAQEDPIVLEAATLDEAKMQAAMLYAGASFKAAPPTSYRILRDGEAEVYRFPVAD